MRSSFQQGCNYGIADASDLLTPALAIYADVVEDNIRAIVRLLGSAERWRPHIKTSKLAFTVRRLVEHGVVNVKCATTLELLTACNCGVRDVLVAYPLTDAATLRVRELATRFSTTEISCLVEHRSHIERWRGSRVGLFIDVNSGMNRTGADPENIGDIVAIAGAVLAAGLRFRGLHYYEGHHTQPDLATRTAEAHRGYQKLMNVIAALEGAGIAIEEVVTSGTPALPCALAFAAFRGGRFLHRVSPGTVVYNDVTSLGQLPAEYGLQPAALVVTTVVSRPTAGLITCDAGHKTVSADAGTPTCNVVGYPELRPLKPSEEHLPIAVPEGTRAPGLGERLYLVPRHICPTVNNFDDALIVREGAVRGVEPVSARGREKPVATARSAAGGGQ